MIQTTNFSQFCDAFRAYDRQDQFSHDAKRVLFDYLENYEDETGKQVELDVIALCCEYTEQTADEVIESYPADFDADELADMSDEEKQELVSDYLNYNTMLCGTTNSGAFVYLQF